MSKINEIYLENILIYINIKTELSKFLLFEKGKKDFLIKYQTDNTAQLVIDNKVYNSEGILNGDITYKMNIPRSVNTLTFEDINDKLLDMINIAQTPMLNTLYFGDACSVFFNITTEVNDYSECSNFWGKILPSGIIHGVNHLVSTIQANLDVLDLVNRGLLNWETFLDNKDFKDYERFIDLYFYRAYKYNQVLLDDINKNNLVLIEQINIYLMFCYMIVAVIVVIVLSYLINKLKNIFTSLLNFIGIIPSKHVIEDQDFLNHILMLEQYISF